MQIEELEGLDLTTPDGRPIEIQYYDFYEPRPDPVEGARNILIDPMLWSQPEKRKIYISVIKAAAGVFERRVYARKCQVREVEKQKARKFLTENHLHGPGSGAFLYLGLYLGDELLQIITIVDKEARKGISGKNCKYQYELLRMATLQNTQVVGGFSKLVKALRARGITEFFSYVDANVYDAAGYYASGFKEVGYTVNDMMWFIPPDCPNTDENLRKGIIDLDYQRGAQLCENWRLKKERNCARIGDLKRERSCARIGDLKRMRNCAEEWTRRDYFRAAGWIQVQFRGNIKVEYRLEEESNDT